MKLDTSLYFVTDSERCGEEDFLQRVEESLKGGVTLLQLREKNKSTSEYISLAERVHEITEKYGVPLIIDDRADVALAAGAEGVHLGAEDMSVKDARKILGDNFIVGATAKTVSKALEAYRGGADYLGVGAIYPTKTKVKTVITSTEALKEICKAVPIAVNAIGGLNKNNLNVLRGTGIDGICVVSAIMDAENPRREAEILFSLQNELKRRAVK